MNGLRPDFVLVHPSNGIVVVEVKDWSAESEYWFEPKNRQFFFLNPEGRTCRVPSPIDKIKLYGAEIKLLLPDYFQTSGRHSIITSCVIFTRWPGHKVNSIFNKGIMHDLNFGFKAQEIIRCADDLAHADIGTFLPCANFNNSNMNKEIADELRHWISSSEFDNEQTRFVQLNNVQSRFVHTRTKSGFRRIKGAAGSGKSVVLAAKACELAQQGKRVLLLSFNITQKLPERPCISLFT